ncbi:DUF2252 domain-containing protein [Pseudonocardia petroleophila]|uniref:DUF2252 family protein n=1 Tax=Pseudonocardia petroleophila TaxID=37331 RepID=A0A7G7MIZ3_9PSEU|nr:DUF2252 family protein [Pseudonocardia petroleophila]QNG52754.1 DUF2252 family protein [Pseudonocardia petroleophila]
MAVNEEFVRHDRSAQFREYAERRARGSVETPPLQLTAHERRIHVRQTLLEDHRSRIENRPDGAQLKFDTLAGDAFTFFRGTALLYYRDHAGTDGQLPIVFTIGDVHPENFGVMVNSDGAPFFGVNDFDEAWAAPFSYDVKRGAVGFWIAAAENGERRRDRRRVVRSFVDGYLTALRAYSIDDRSSTFQFRHDTSPKIIRDLLERSMTGRSAFLARYVDPETGRFRPSRKRVPHSSHVAGFQKVVDRYVKDNDLGGVARPKSFFRVLDVARKKGSGTGSLGLDRYWVLLQGWDAEPGSRVVLEFKKARRSALHGLVPVNDVSTVEGDEESARRIVTAHEVHLVNGDPLYGFAEIEGRSFLARERSPYKDGISVADLDLDGMVSYAHVCGQALAQPHARSDAETGIMQGSAETRILSSITPELFCSDVVEFAEFAARRVYADHRMFCEDQSHGAFRYWDAG